MRPHLTNDQLILLKQLGFLHGSIQCYMRQPVTFESIAKCHQYRKFRTQPPQRTLTYHRDRFPEHITPDDQNQFLDAVDPHQMDVLRTLLSHRSRRNWLRGGLSLQKEKKERNRTTNFLLFLSFLNPLSSRSRCLIFHIVLFVLYNSYIITIADA